jgi:hypothetical protein
VARRLPLCTRAAPMHRRGMAHDRAIGGEPWGHARGGGQFEPADPLHGLRARSAVIEHGREVNAAASARV